MPRTKHIRKPKLERESLEETDLLMRDFERQAQLQIMKMEAEAKMAIKSLETFVDVTLSRLPMEIRKMTLGELLAYDADSGKENEVSSSVDDFSLPSAPTTVKSKKKRITATSDDGYVTESISTVVRKSRAPKAANETTRQRTRSSSQNSRKNLSEITSGIAIKETAKKTKGKKSTQADLFKTPAPLKQSNNEYGLVTPKVKPNTPLNVLRRPKQGEMVLSMQGSPLLVSAIVQEESANINVPLKNGSVLSLLPKEGLRMSHIPNLDSETMRELETLKSHIEKMISAK